MIEDDDEISEEQLFRLDSEKRHKEMSALMKQMIAAIKEDDKSSQISQEVSKSSEAINKFIGVLQTYISKEDKEQEITVNTNQEKVVEEIARMSEQLLKSLNELNTQLKFVDNKPKEYEHKVVRNSASGLIETIISKAK